MDHSVSLDVILRKESIVNELAKIVYKFSTADVLGFTYLPGDSVHGIKVPEHWVDESAKASWITVAYRSLLASWAESERRFPTAARDTKVGLSLRGLIKEEVEDSLIQTLVRMLEYVDVHELIHANTDEPEHWTVDDAETKTIEKAESLMKHARMVIV